MEELLQRIDELVAEERLPWTRSGRRVRVAFSRNGRSQVVLVAVRRDRCVYSSVVAYAHLVNEDRRSLAFRLLRRNALKSVVTFGIDSRDRVIGLVDQPVESMRTNELRFYLETLARECDRLEYILTGADIR